MAVGVNGAGGVFGGNGGMVKHNGRSCGVSDSCWYAVLYAIWPRNAGASRSADGQGQLDLPYCRDSDNISSQPKAHHRWIARSGVKMAAKDYKSRIMRLIADAPFDIDTDIVVSGRLPTLANSEFLTNREQGDWAEELVFHAINRHSDEYRAVRYGRGDALSAGDPGFSEFYAAYQDEINAIGKKPDILIYRYSDLPSNDNYDLDDVATIGKAIAAIEVRSSSFLSQKYADFMTTRNRTAEAECARLRRLLLMRPYGDLLSQRNPQIYRLIHDATSETFRELDFRRPSWSSSPELRQMTAWLKALKEQIKILHKRDYLSITPKLEDLALVNRWIQNFGVPHYYLQVFFDKAYIIPFQRILEIVSNPVNEGVMFSVEQDTKNQRKTTIKIDIGVCQEILGRIDMPQHRSALKELDRGRLLFYVTFHGGAGYLDRTTFLDEIVNAR